MIFTFKAVIAAFIFTSILFFKVGQYIGRKDNQIHLFKKKMKSFLTPDMFGGSVLFKVTITLTLGLIVGNFWLDYQNKVSNESVNSEANIPGKNYFGTIVYVIDDETLIVKNDKGIQKKVILKNMLINEDIDVTELTGLSISMIGTKELDKDTLLAHSAVYE